MTRLEQLLVNIAKLCERLKIPYAVTGGVAVVFWGRPRFTQDIDVVIEITSSQISQFIRELKTLGKNVYADEEMAKDAFERKSEFNVIFPGTRLKVDFWISKSNEYYKEKIQRARVKNLYGQRVYFVSPEDLILSKLLWFKESESSRHLEDAESIVSIQKNKLSRRYLKKWAARFKVVNLLKRLFRQK